jgi:hypothetical protein
MTPAAAINRRGGISAAAELASGASDVAAAAAAATQDVSLHDLDVANARPQVRALIPARRMSAEMPEDGNPFLALLWSVRPSP